MAGAGCQNCSKKTILHYILSVTIQIWLKLSRYESSLDDSEPIYRLRPKYVFKPRKTFTLHDK